MLKVVWPSTSATHADAWRVLDLCGLTNTVRESRNFTRAGYLFVNGNRATTETKIPIGQKTTIQLRFPNAIRKQRTFMLVNNQPFRRPRDTDRQGTSS